MMCVTVQATNELARALRQESPATAESREVTEIAGDVGAVLEPLHAGTRDSSLRRYFILQVPDQPTAERVLARLRQVRDVTAAYVKPPDALP